MVPPPMMRISRPSRLAFSTGLPGGFLGKGDQLNLVVLGLFVMQFSELDANGRNTPFASVVLFDFPPA